MPRRFWKIGNFGPKNDKMPRRFFKKKRDPPVTFFMFSRSPRYFLKFSTTISKVAAASHHFFCRRHDYVYKTQIKMTTLWSIFVKKLKRGVVCLRCPHCGFFYQTLKAARQLNRFAIHHLVCLPPGATIFFFSSGMWCQKIFFSSSGMWFSNDRNK